MTPQTQEIVDRFRKVLFDGKFYTAQFDNPALKADTQKCIQCAIVAVEMQLSDLEESIQDLSHNKYSVSVLDSKRTYYNSILTELKNELL